MGQKICKINIGKQTVTLDGKTWSREDFLQWCFMNNYEGTMHKVEGAFLHADQVIWDILTDETKDL